MLKIRRKGLIKPWKRRLAIRFSRGIAVGAALTAVILIGLGFSYTWVIGKNTKAAEKNVESSLRTNTTKKPSVPSVNTPVGVSIQSLTTPITPGSTVYMSIRTLESSKCDIKVFNEKKDSMSDSGLVTQTADEYGSASWTWTIPYSAALGKWNVDVTCYRYAKSGFVRGDLVVVSHLD